MFRNVVSFACDSCGVVEEVENVTDVLKDNPPPKTWSTLVGYTNGATTIDMHLCLYCMEMVKGFIEGVAARHSSADDPTHKHKFVSDGKQPILRLNLGCACGARMEGPDNG